MLDRAGLERSSCECDAVVTPDEDRLLRNPDGRATGRGRTPDRRWTTQSGPLTTQIAFPIGVIQPRVAARQ